MYVLPTYCRWQDIFLEGNTTSPLLCPHLFLPQVSMGKRPPCFPYYHDIKNLYKLYIFFYPAKCVHTRTADLGGRKAYLAI